MRINNAQNQNGIPLVSETPFYRLQKTIAKQVENGKVILTQDDFPTYMDDWYITKIQWGNDLILPNIKYTENTIEIDICPEDEVVAGKVIIEVRQPNVNSIPAEVVFSDELNVAMKISHDAPVSEIQQAGTQLHENNPEKYTSSHYRSLHDFPSDDFIFTNEVVGKDCWYTSLETTLNAQGEIKSLPEVKTWTTDLPSLRLGNKMFMDGNIETFVCALNRLENGTSMFQNTTRLQTFVSRLPRLVNGTNMFYNSSVQTIDFNMPQLVNGEQMFYNSGMVLFAANAPKLENGTRMFDENANLVEFKSNMENLKNGYYMFNNCSQMKQYTSSTPNLINVEGCFNGCTKLENIKGDFGKITSTVNFLAGCSNLIEFDASLASLVDGNNTFQSCQRLKTIKTDLSKLTTANNIFSSCVELLSYSGNLSSFTNADGGGLFRNCIKLQKFSGNLSNLIRTDNMFNTTELITFYGSMERVSNMDGFFSGNANLIEIQSNFAAASSVENMLQGCTSLLRFNANLTSAINVNDLFADCNNLREFYGNLSAASDLSQMFMNKTQMNAFSGSIKNARNLSKMFYNSSVSSVNFVEPIVGATYENFDVEDMFYGTSVKPVLDKPSLENIMANFPRLTGENLKKLVLVRNNDIDDTYIVLFNTKMVEKGYEIIWA